MESTRVSPDVYSIPTSGSVSASKTFEPSEESLTLPCSFHPPKISKKRITDDDYNFKLDNRNTKNHPLASTLK